jgi:hypothetical protein
MEDIGLMLTSSTVFRRDEVACSIWSFCTIIMYQDFVVQVDLVSSAYISKLIVQNAKIDAMCSEIMQATA